VEVKGGASLMEELPEKIFLLLSHCQNTLIQPNVKRIVLMVVTLQSRAALGRFCCGLGVRAVRAGSIGRDGQRLEESTEPLQEEAGGLGPRPLHEEITAS